MKASEFKLRLNTTINNLIDTYYAENTLVERLTNSTLKVVVKANIDKIDGILKYVTNANGDIDADMIINMYADSIDEEGICFNIKNYIQDGFIRDLLPNKSLMINKDDILNIIRCI